MDFFLNKKKLISLAILFIFIFAFFSAIGAAGADEGMPSGVDSFKKGLEKTGGEIGYKPGEEGKGEMEIAQFIGNIIAAVMAFVGVAFFILIIMGALDIVGAGGNDEMVKKGKDKIKNGAIGVLVIFAAYLFAHLVLTIASGQVVKIFKL
ncbi:MAG: hypothetical protein PHQ42_00930 [Patescibacteria group bacterium]|nr:hypothetical protein [Patescibacteria group bacterium]